MIQRRWLTVLMIVFPALVVLFTFSGCGGGGTGGGSMLSGDDSWSHQAYLKAPNNSNGDGFGCSVAISGDTIVVGALGEASTTTAIINGNDLSATNNSGSKNGAASVFVRSGSTWSHQAYLKAPNNSDGDGFGGSVAISGDTIVVGAPWEANTTTAIINGNDLSVTNDSGLGNGAVYVFVRSDSTWSHQAYLKAPNNSDGDGFGGSVAISGDTIVVGAPWEASTTTAIINGNDLSVTNDSGLGNGAVYVFVRSDSTWSHQAYLKAPNNSHSGLFGSHVAISGDTIVVGAPWEASTTTAIINGNDLSATNNSGGANGAAYVFVRSGSTWSHQAYLKAPNNSNSDCFGYFVAVSGDTIAVGAPGEDSTTAAIINGNDLSATNDSGLGNGAVYVFVRSGSTWSHQAYLKAPNTSTSDLFGSLAVSGDTIVVGAPGEGSTTATIVNGAHLNTMNDSGSKTGAAYVFVRSGSTWTHQAYLKAPNNSYGDSFGVSVAVSGDTIAVGAPGEASTTMAIINGNDLSATNDIGNNNGAAYVFVRE